MDTQLGINLKIYKTRTSVLLDHDYLSPSSPNPNESHIISSRNPNKIFLDSIQGLGNPTVIYTDGSKVPNVGAGFAVFCFEPLIQIQYKVNPFNSIFEAEAMAIIEALHSSLNYNLENVLITTDSLSVLLGLAALDTKGSQYPLIYVIKNTLLDLRTQNISTSFIWIPSHASIKGNEMADRLAYNAALAPIGNERAEDIGSKTYTFAHNIFYPAKQEIKEEASEFFKILQFFNSYQPLLKDTDISIVQGSNQGPHGFSMNPKFQAT